MRLIGLAVVLAVSLTLAPLDAEGQQADKGMSSGRTAVVGVLLSDSPALYLPEFRRTLADLGWIDGKTVRLEVRWADGRQDRLPDLARELVQLNVDVIATLLGTPPALAAKQATTTIPIVFATGGDPVAFGIVSSHARPERNLTGVGSTVSINYKRLQLLKEAVPRAKQMAFLANAGNPIHGRLMKAAEQAARQLGLLLLEVRVQDSLDSLDSAFATMRRQRVDAVVVQGDAFFVSHRVRIVDFAATARLPAIYSNRLYPDAGGLMSLGVDFAALNRRAAEFVDKILRGARPGDLPVEETTKFELLINLKTARALGLTIPQTLLLRADRVIE